MSLKEELSKAFGSIANAVGDAAKTTADKAKQMAEIAKLNLKISAEEDKVRKAQMQLGEAYYNDFEAGLPIEGENFLSLCEQIRLAKEAIADYRTAVEALKADKPAEEKSEEPTCCCKPAEEKSEEPTCCCEPAEEKSEEPTCCKPAEEKSEEPTCCKPAENIEFTVVDDKPETQPEDNA